ncbi:MAG: acetyl-CoA C-acyltransferase [Pelomonas sp.]|nr:acetyl-CoA C-acyltransferase [Roseateles sp.]
MTVDPRRDLWLASGLRTPFAKVDGALAAHDALGLSVPVAKAMLDQQAVSGLPDFAVWGTVVPNLTWSNLAREVLIEAGAPAVIPAFSTGMACSTSMTGALQAASMIDGRSRHLALVGGAESMSRIQLGLGQNLSDWLRGFQRQRTWGQKLAHALALKRRDVALYLPAIRNRTTGLSMGEHTEITAKAWSIAREDQDRVALESHQRAVSAWEKGFFDSLVIPAGKVTRDSVPRPDTSLAKLAKLSPAFDPSSGAGTLTAGNSSPLTDGAAGLWVGDTAGMQRLDSSLPRVRLVDWELTAVDFRTEGLLMAPAYGVPRLLARHGLRLPDIALWEIHEAFAAQLLFHIRALEDANFLREKVGITAPLGTFPRQSVNPNGGSTAIGHPFGATGARLLSQIVKELAAMPRGSYGVASICADGGQGSVALLQAA